MNVDTEILKYRNFTYVNKNRYITHLSIRKTNFDIKTYFHIKFRKEWNFVLKY